MLDFENKNAFLLEKLDFLMLKFKIDGPEQHGKVESLRNRLVGESHPYKGLFRKNINICCPVYLLLSPQQLPPL